MAKFVEIMTAENEVCYQKELSGKDFSSRKQTVYGIFMYFYFQYMESCQSGRMGLSRKQVNG